MKTDTIGYDKNSYLVIDNCVAFKRELCFELGKCMWIKYWSVYQDHMKYVRNDIVKPFRVKILRYTKRVREMHDPEKFLPPPSVNGECSMEANWWVHNKEFTTNDLRLSIKEGLPKTMRS